jgi:hypothetical protein
MRPETRGSPITVSYRRIVQCTAKGSPAEWLVQRSNEPARNSVTKRLDESTSHASGAAFTSSTPPMQSLDGTLWQCLCPPSACRRRSTSISVPRCGDASGAHPEVVAEKKSLVVCPMCIWPELLAHASRPQSGISMATPGRRLRSRLRNPPRSYVPARPSRRLTEHAGRHGEGVRAQQVAAGPR